MKRDDVPGVPQAVTEIEDPPGELEALVEKEEVSGPSPGGLEGPPADDGGGLADRGDLAAPRLVSDPDARHPVARGGAAVRIVEARRHRAEALVLGEHARDLRERVVVGEEGVVVEEEQELSLDVGDTGIAPARHSQVLGNDHSADRAGKAIRLGAVAHDHDVEVDASLAEERVERAAEIVRPPALGQDDAAVRRQYVFSRGHAPEYRSPPMALKIVFWSSLALLLWTHVGYPLAIALLSSVRRRVVRKEDITPSVAVIVVAHNEERVLARRLDNLLALDYPAQKLEVVIASDDSADRTDEIAADYAARDARVRLLRRPREGKVAAQDAAVGSVISEVVAFSDANALWAPSALRLLVRNLADPQVGYVCGRLDLEAADGTNREGLYWRYELWLRRRESLTGSVTGGNGAIYALRRSDYVATEHDFAHDIGLPYLMVQRGLRAVYEPEAVAVEKPSRDAEDEFRRKTRMFARSWRHILQGWMFRGGSPLYLLQLFSHRGLRYASGLLHVVLLATSAALVREGLVYELALSAQLAWLALALAGRLRLPLPGAALAYYYFLVSLATVVGLVNYLRFGVPVVWEKAAGTRPEGTS
jgi:glycosyltransferase involved in cell wall biosynthesis